LGLYGNPGVGKTEITRNGIAYSLGRKLACINCGGLRDSSYLQGFEYSYQGSKYGKIVESLILGGEMDPVIFIDELDKISTTRDGQDIENTLVHILDPTQNSDFRDKYFSEIPIDLSRCIFVVAFNHKSKINPILLDRVNIISVPDPTVDAKLHITTRHLLPRIFGNYKNFKMDDITFTPEILKYIINKYTKEPGVRSLNRCIDTIISRLNVVKMLGTATKKFKFSFLVDVEFPLKLSEKIIDKVLIKSNDPMNEEGGMLFQMYT
jgi:ATP-dependent Lon protease